MLVGCGDPTGGSPPSNGTGDDGVGTADSGATGGNTEHGPSSDPTAADDGTDGDSGGDDGPHSGSRLELRYAGDVLSIWDTELEAECAFRVSADGRLRCLPGRYSQGTAWEAATNEWLPYVEGNAGCAPKYIISDVGVDSFSCTPDGWAVRAVSDRVIEICLGVTDSFCTLIHRVDDSGIPGAGYWVAGGEIDPATFVAAEVASPEADGRLVFRWLDGEDGSRVPWDLFDTEYEWPCAWRNTADGSLRCLPVAPPDGWAFAANLVDTLPYRHGNEACVPESVEWIHTASAFSCDPNTESVYDIGDAAYELCVQTTDGLCSVIRGLSDDAPAGAAFWLAGVEMPIEGFVAGEERTSDTPERLERRSIATVDGFVTDIGAYDDELGMDCGFALAKDGRTRCLPTTFVDSGNANVTTEDYTPARRGNDGCPPAFLVRSESVSSFSCDPAATEVFAVAGTTERVCNAVSSGMCISWSEIGIDAPGGATYWLAGESIPPAMFAAADE